MGIGLVLIGSIARVRPVLGSAGGVLLWRRRRAAACAPGAACGSLMITAFVTGVLSLGAVLVVLGFMFA
jgi:hypothetical protein